MASTEVSLRDQLRAGPPRLGISIVSMSPVTVEVAGLSGCDFVWLDLEHGTADLMHVEHLCRAADLHGCLPLLRIQDGSRTSILRALEAGGRIIVVPQVHTPQQAAAVVEYGKYPPVGQRGFYGGSRGLRYGFDGGTPEETFARANRETCLLAQIESTEAVTNAEAIIATPGLDGILVGPGDLSVSMGITGQWDSPELMATVERVLRLANEQGKVAATTCPTLEMARRWKAAGVHLLALGGDMGLMRQALTERLTEIRGL